MNWQELEERFFTTFSESIETESLIEEYGEERVHYGLTQVLARAARGKMPDKSAVRYCIGIMEHATEKEANVSYKKKHAVSLNDIGWWQPLKERLQGLKEDGKDSVSFNYLGKTEIVMIAQIEGVMESYANHTLNREWLHWLDIVMKNLCLGHLYSNRLIAMSSARKFPEYQAEVMAYLSKPATAE